MKLISIHWPLVFVTTLVIYILMIISFPFNRQVSTVFLFLLIAYWSRLPGVGIPTPFFVLYQADLVDMFSLIVAINVGGPYGALFSIFGNIASRAAGVFPPWAGVINDAASQSVICMFIGFVHALTGNIFVTMMVYTIIRRLGFIVGYFLSGGAYGSPVYFFVILWPGATAVSLVINGFYAKYFGFFLDGVLKQGVQFNWPLFVFATVLIVVMWRLMVGRRSSQYLHQGAIVRAMFRKFVGEKQVKDGKIAVIEDEEIVREVKGII